MISSLGEADCALARYKIIAGNIHSALRAVCLSEADSQVSSSDSKPQATSLRSLPGVMQSQPLRGCHTRNMKESIPPVQVEMFQCSGRSCTGHPHMIPLLLPSRTGGRYIPAPVVRGNRRGCGHCTEFRTRPFLSHPRSG